MRFLRASIWSFIFCWKEDPKRKGTASLKVDSSSTRVDSSLLRYWEALWRLSADRWAEALPTSFRACWADSAASLGLSVPDLADSSMFTRGTAASRTHPCNPARPRSADLAPGVILDMMVGSSFGTFVKGVSGIGCFLLILLLFWGRSFWEKASFTSFAVVAEIFRTTPSADSESLGSQKTDSL